MIALWAYWLENGVMRLTVWRYDGYCARMGFCCTSCARFLSNFPAFESWSAFRWASSSHFPSTELLWFISPEQWPIFWTWISHQKGCDLRRRPYWLKKSECASTFSISFASNQTEITNFVWRIKSRGFLCFRSFPAFSRTLDCMTSIFSTIKTFRFCHIPLSCEGEEVLSSSRLV